MMHVFVYRAYVFALCSSLSTQVKEMYRRTNCGHKERHEKSESFAGGVEPKKDQMYKLNMA